MLILKKIGNIKNKTILVRVDFNVPIHDNKITDPFRINSSLETIDFLLGRGAKVVLLSHVGDDGQKSLLPVVKYLKNKKYNMLFENSNDLNKIKSTVESLKQKDVLLIENIRRFEEEKKCDKSFSKFWANVCDSYVNEAFSVSHRKHASIVGIPKYQKSFLGFQFEREIKMLTKALKPKKPFLFILGGAKFSTKLPLLKKYLTLADNVFVGGALANILLQKTGYEIGKSLVEEGTNIPKNILLNKKLSLPIDVVVLRNKVLKEVLMTDVQKEDTIIDVGTLSLKKLKAIAESSKLVVWNGPLGKNNENKNLGTIKLIQILKNTKAETIIGGGDTAEIINKLKIASSFSFVSTGGGATLDFLADGKLVGMVNNSK